MVDVAISSFKGLHSEVFVRGLCFHISSVLFIASSCQRRWCGAMMAVAQM